MKAYRFTLHVCLSAVFMIVSFVELNQIQFLDTKDFIGKGSNGTPRIFVDGEGYMDVWRLKLSIASACSDVFIGKSYGLDPSWQAVSEKNDIYIYSAFLDANEIRLVGIRTRSAEKNLTCQTWYIDVTPGTVTVETTPAKLKAISGGERSHTFTTGYTLCPVNKTRHPFAVSIVDGDDACRHPNNAFPVPKAPPSVHMLPNYNFTVCIPPIFGDYPPTHRLIEWIEVNRLFGVQYFTFYNASMSDRLARILRQYENRGLLEILQYKVPTRDIHYGAQIASMHDCLHRNQHRAMFTSFQDLDELIIPHSPEDFTWADMLKRLPVSCSYSFRSSFFIGSYKAGSNNGDISLEHIVNQSVVLRHLKRNKQIFAHTVRSKVIVRPDEINTFGVHVTWSCKPGKTIGYAGPGIGMVHHYRGRGKKSDPNNTVVDETALKYNDTLRQSLSQIQELISQAYS